MQKKVITGLTIAIVLLLFSYSMLHIAVRLFPGLCEEYCNPAVFQTTPERMWLFFLHPFVLSFALLWFWQRFKSLLQGNLWVKGVEFGLVYGVVATLPAMWITFSALNVSFQMVLTWIAYSIIQVVIAGIIMAKMNP
ncbi:MAG TPA: hypothetical protein PK239_18265 [Chitinophagales bacterium]|nr:hypothetical protein [Chitinophagales bacterium]HRK29226.1 hypothetical protein [Chitinophagales bacterium]